MDVRNVFNYPLSIGVKQHDQYGRVCVCVCVCVNVQSQVVSLDMPASALGHQFTNLRLNSQYSFRVRASTAVGAGEPTRVVVASTVSQGKIKPNSRRLQNTFVKLLANACYNLQVLTVSLHS